MKIQGFRWFIGLLIKVKVVFWNLLNRIQVGILFVNFGIGTPKALPLHFPTGPTNRDLLFPIEPV